MSKPVVKVQSVSVTHTIQLSLEIEYRGKHPLTEDRLKYLREQVEIVVQKDVVPSLHQVRFVGEPE